MDKHVTNCNEYVAEGNVGIISFSSFESLIGGVAEFQN